MMTFISKLLSRRTIASAAAIVFAFILFAGGMFPVHALTVSAVKKNDVVLLRRIKPKDHFEYRAIHSVELSPYVEYFRINPNYTISLYETAFQSSNVGLPYAAFGQEKFIREDNGFRIVNMDRNIPELLVWANGRYKNQLTYGNESWLLHAFKGNTLMRIGVDSMPFIKFVYLFASSI